MAFSEDVKTVLTDLTEISKNLAIQIQSHSFLLYALISLSDERVLQQVKKILESHVATGEYRGVSAAALQDALRTFSVLCGSDGHPNNDVKKLFLQLIPGGKGDE